jgi:hypothetical protein
VNDTTPPSVTIVSPTSAKLSNPNLKISASALDNVSVTRMEVYVDGSLLVGTNSGSISATAKVGAGTHVVAINAYDSAGNKGSKSMTVYR